MQCQIHKFTPIQVKICRFHLPCPMPHASNPLRLTHTCNLPCMKTISKTKDFCFSSHESFIGHTPIIMLDHPLIFSLDTLQKYCGQPSDIFIGHTLKILWTTLRYFSLDTLRKYYGQPSDIFIGHILKILWTTLRKYCGQPFDIFIEHTPIIMLDNHPIKTACSKPCRALTPDIRDVPMHMKCDATTWYLLICMHACINIILRKLHVI